MSYFSRFPLVNYNGLFQVNLTKRVSISEAMKTNAAYYVEYEVQEGETPELLADKFYDDVQLSWVILMINDIVNVFEEWPKSYAELDDFIKEKYEDVNGIHHHISAMTSNIVSPEIHPDYDLVPVTNTEHEYNLNDGRRSVKLLLPEYVGELVSQHKELMRKGR